MTNNNSRKIMKATKQAMRIDFLAVVSVAMQLFALVFAGAYMIGIVTVIAVCANKYVQSWWIPFGKFAIWTTVAVFAILAVALLLTITYVFSYVMLERSKSACAMVYPEYRAPFKARARRYQAICNGISTIKLFFVEAVKFVVELSEYAQL